LPTPNLHLFARNASDGDHFLRKGRPFEYVDIAFDKNTFEPLLTSVGGSASTIDDRGLAISKALLYFRGTFVDGILQPNVRLGKGLQPLNEWPMLEPRESEQTKTRETQVETITKKVSCSVKVPSTKPCVEQPKTQSARAKPNTQPMKPSRRPRDGLEAQKALEELKMREAALLAKSRELEVKEEALRWKHKMFLLEQKMAKMSVNPMDGPRTVTLRPNDRKAVSTDRRSSRRSPFPRSGMDRPNRTSMERPQPQDSSDPSPPYEQRKSDRRQSLGPKSQSGNSGDSSSHISDTASEPKDHDDIFPYNEFSVDDPTPPSALSALRSRLHQSGTRR
jgi:hypothetical protein